mgnify:CR=1 FL=1
MTQQGPAEELRAAGAAIAVALALLEPHRNLFERFEDEARNLLSFGHIIDPTLFKRATSEPWRETYGEILGSAHRFLKDAGSHREVLEQQLAAMGHEKGGADVG